MSEEWGKTEELPSLGYTCGYCNYSMASKQGYVGPHKMDLDEIGEPKEPYTSYNSYIYLCTNCGEPSLIETKTIEMGPHVSGPDIEYQLPNPKETTEASYKKVAGISGEVKTAYDEANKCFIAGAWTATAMLCRKILMNIACSFGAKEGESFVHYVEYLYEKRYLNQQLEVWARRVKDVGNDANHKVMKISRDEARDIFDFIYFLLIVLYELPHRARKSDRTKRKGRLKAKKQPNNLPENKP